MHPRPLANEYPVATSQEAGSFTTPFAQRRTPRVRPEGDNAKKNFGSRELNIPVRGPLKNGDTDKL